MIANRGLEVGESLLRTFRFILFCLIGFLPCRAASYDFEFGDGDSGAQAGIVKIAQGLKPDIIVDSLSHYLVNNGYLEADVSLSPDDANTIRVDLGPRFYISTINVSSPESHDEVMVNKPLAQYVYESTIKSIQDDYRNSGYYFVESVIDSIVRIDSAISIIMSINSGPLAQLTMIEFAGLTKTDPDHLKKYLVVKPGDTLTPVKIDRSIDNLKKLDYIEISELPSIAAEPGLFGARMIVPVREKKQYYFDGALGYIPDNNGTFVWYMNFIARNFLGQGRKAEVLADRRDDNISIFNVGYRQPVFWAGPGEIRLDIKSRDYRDYFYEFGAGVKYGWTVSRNFDLAVTFNWKNIEPADELQPSYSSISAATTLHWGKVIPQRRPNLQTSLMTGVSYSRRLYRSGDNTPGLSNSSYNDTRAEIELASQLKIINGWSMFGSTVFKDVESSDNILPLSELFLFGGSDILRGYRTDQFSARRLVGITHEWRVFISESDYFYPFVDAVYFEWDEAAIDDQPVQKTDTKAGFGFGVSLSSTAGRLGLAFAWGESVAVDKPRLYVYLSNQF